MKFKYGLDDRPPFIELLIFGLQWLAISIPTIIIIGKVVAGQQFTGPAEQVIYVQKLFFVTAVFLLVQLLWGHRLPLIIGPAAVLLVGMLSSQGSSLASIYSAILVGGVILTILSITGLFSYLKSFFTSRVVATILILIAFTLTPMIMDLIITSAGTAVPLFNLLFVLSFVILMFVAGRYLTGIWKSTVIIWGTIAGSLLHFVIFARPAGSVTGDNKLVAAFFDNLNFHLVLEPGVFISFLICFLALSINDLGYIQSVGELIKPDNMRGRITRGISLTGLANIVSGLLGVIGPVNFSLSPGVIASTGCASRFALIPTGLGLLALSFMPAAIAFMSSIPSVVIGGALIYIMCSQIAAGMQMAFYSPGGFSFENGLVMGLPLMLSIIISFLPGEVVSTFPATLRPILGNGFVVWVLAVLIMEHVIIREKERAVSTARG